MTSNKYDILKVRDSEDKNFIKHPVLPDLSARILICGRSMLSGKTNLCINIICLPQFYSNHFKGDNIYIVSPSLKTDKLQHIIRYKKIPEDNLFPEYDEETMMELYELLKEKYEADIEDKKKPQHKLILIDDCSFSGDLKSKNFGFIALLGQNSRHYLISVILISQKYCDTNINYRQNMSCLICFATTLTECDMICQENNCSTSKKKFLEEFKKATRKKHDFFCVDYTKEVNDGRYKHNFTKNIIMD